MTTLLVWANAAHDTRFTASDVHTYYVRHGVPAALARDIDRRGYLAVEELLAKGDIVSNRVAPGTLAVRGHGVLVKYPNGHSRVVRAQGGAR